MRITEFFETSYRPRKLRGRSPNTIRLYRFSLKNLDRTLCKAAKLSDLTDDNIGLVMQSILDRGGSPFTANKERSQLIAIWRYAAQLGLVEKWPTITAEPTPERVPVAWLREDIARLMTAIDSQPGVIGRAPASVWWRAIVSVCLDTGERIGAVSQAEWAWLERSWMLIPAEARKGRKRDRRYLLSPATLQALSQLRKYSCGDTKMFVWPYCKNYLWLKFTKILKDNGMPHGPKDKFHRLRKTLGSVVHAAGMDAQDALDHESRRTTKAYLDPRFTRDQQPSDILAAWLRNPPKPKDKRQFG